MEIILDNKIVSVKIIRKNNKNLYFRFDNDSLVVTCNHLISENYIMSLIKKNERSLTKMYQKVQEINDNNAFFNYLGEKYTILYDETIEEVRFDNDIIMVKNEKMLNKFYNDQVVKIFTERVNKCKLLFDDIPNFRLRFRKMKTRWGVNNITDCVITLNTELLKKEVSLLDYVIIHEICHFYEANHSSKFWLQVKKRYPYYELARKKLREV
ncbi:MAG: M48 family metallopeptidase [Bacilli bacterium]